MAKMHQHSTWRKDATKCRHNVKMILTNRIDIDIDIVAVLNRGAKYKIKTA